MFNSMASNFCHMIKPRTLFLILFLSSVTFSVFAKPGKYDELLQKKFRVELDQDYKHG